MSRDEFGGIGFAPGSVRGVRSFDVDKLGRLVGVSFPQVWTPGENHAVCLREEPMKRANGGVIQVNGTLGFPTFHNMYIDEPRKSLPAPSEPIAHPEHSMESCGHGFYAYYDGSDDYGRPSRVSAVIEGYGEAIIGTRGFRAMKSRLVAITIREDVPAVLANRVQLNYSSVPRFDSFDEMVIAFPPDRTTITPESDPEFWTRST